MNKTGQVRPEASVEALHSAVAEIYLTVKSRWLDMEQQQELLSFFGKVFFLINFLLNPGLKVYFILQ